MEAVTSIPEPAPSNTKPVQALVDRTRELVRYLLVREIIPRQKASRLDPRGRASLPGSSSLTRSLAVGGKQTIDLNGTLNGRRSAMRRCTLLSLTVLRQKP
ncbi:hypothetical protein PR048_010114 [Dryococelus australis]|uniref:Uncharacterized protein n=1 Tax=Dryococelus australis TaxID=614101 RepID=A0ABQ9I2V9_9NEOP|nr:hypothetical protein PR048_010114 [Dryococelus australis]